jgi:hypothetical protein
VEEEKPSAEAIAAAALVTTAGAPSVTLVVKALLAVATPCKKGATTRLVFAQRIAKIAASCGGVADCSTVIIRSNAARVAGTVLDGRIVLNAPRIANPTARRTTALPRDSRRT